MLEMVFREAELFDVVHFHTDYLHFTLSRRFPIRQMTTLHGRLDLPDLAPLYREFGDMPVVSISDAQRRPLPWANWLGTVYHGLPEDLYPFQPKHGEYLAFLGRIGHASFGYLPSSSPAARGSSPEPESSRCS
jgi:hypothetical protein